MAELYPAIDLLGGKVVRLTRGDYALQTTYSDDPVAVAFEFASEGATWIHVVDLNAARSGTPQNRAIIGAIASAVEGRARVQTGGGVRDVRDAEELAALGVERVVMGSAAVSDASLVDRVADVIAVAIGLDHRGGELATHGWTQGSGVQLRDVLDRYPRAAAFVVTDIGRDGMLSGPDVDGLRAVASATDVPVIASGGVATLDDLRALSTVGGIAGVIAGRAIYEGRFTVADAVEVLRGS